MSASTTIIIPGRETQTIPGLTLSKADVIASFAGDIDLSRMVATESREGEGVVISFANKTGTKGSDVTVNIDNVNISGNVIVNTRIEIPGREAQIIPGLVMTQDDVRAAFAGEVDLAGMNCTESQERDCHVISFANRTGTKGQTNIMSAIFQAVQDAQANQGATVEDYEEEYPEEEEEEVVLSNTRIYIPGREVQLIPGIVLDAQMVKNTFAGEIDLSGYNVEEIDRGDTLDVVFTARTGTKGE